MNFNKLINTMTEDFSKANYPTVWERFHSADQPTADLYELLAFAYSEGRRAVEDTHTPDYLASRLALQGYKGMLTKERIVYYGGARTGVNTEALKVEGI